VINVPAQECKTNLILVRHGEAFTSSKGNGRLTSQGREQARRLGRWLAKNYQIQALYASPLTRTRETAQIINQDLGLPVIFKEGLKGLGGEEKLRETLPKSGDRFEIDSSLRSAKPLAEEYQHLCRQVLETLSEILQVCQAKTILLVSHTDIIATLIRSLFGGHQMAVNSDYTGVSLLHWEEDRWEVVYLNRREHLV
jgi:broad specificity phosphatase PhoE